LVYMKHGIWIKNDDWIILLKNKKGSTFSKAILRYFYSPQDLIKRCVKPGENVKTPNGKNPRVCISPKKMDIMEMCLEYYVKKEKPGIGKESLKQNVTRLTHYISEEINSVRKEFRNKLQ
ncbi:uncharacterized protein LOC111643761, partial [Copidosoma floridanum]|uniref:uncharacterized protein LOC111643761 n=1 Tax=Copidosoma floridanum TaxID=29053 RepID=UPI000C6FB985